MSNNYNKIFDKINTDTFYFARMYPYEAVVYEIYNLAKSSDAVSIPSIFINITDSFIFRKQKNVCLTYVDALKKRLPSNIFFVTKIEYALTFNDYWFKIYLELYKQTIPETRNARTTIVWTLGLKSLTNFLDTSNIIYTIADNIEFKVNDTSELDFNKNIDFKFLSNDDINNVYNRYISDRVNNSGFRCLLPDGSVNILHTPVTCLEQNGTIVKTDNNHIADVIATYNFHNVPRTNDYIGDYMLTEGQLELERATEFFNLLVKKYNLDKVNYIPKACSDIFNNWVNNETGKYVEYIYSYINKNLHRCIYFPMLKSVLDSVYNEYIKQSRKKFKIPFYTESNDITKLFIIKSKNIEHYAKECTGIIAFAVSIHFVSKARLLWLIFTSEKVLISAMIPDLDIYCDSGK